MRFIGLDVHRTFAEVAVLAEGQVHAAGRVATTALALEAFARTLRADDQVVLEATLNTQAIVRVLRPHVARVAIANPLRTRLIAEAKIKTDKIDAAVLAQLLAAGFLPEVWMPDETTAALRRRVARRTQLVRQRTRLKNQVHAILARNLIPPCPAADLFGHKGRAWLARQPLPSDEQSAVATYLRTLDLAGIDLRAVEENLAQAALPRADVRHLITIPGVDAIVALSLVAAIGDVGRFASPLKLIGYLGLDPRVRQSGLQPARSGPITKQGRAQARGMLVEAAWVAAKTPGPLRAFSCACARAAEPKSRRSPPPASSPSSRGTCSPRDRTTPGRARRSRRRNCAASNSALGYRPAAATPAQPTTTTSKRSGRASTP
jgi:transposase